jgi:aminoglycoside phosphotransferase (APT) family kinase protein
VASLEGWLRDHVAGFAGPVTVTQFSGGQSNPTYRLDTVAGPFVLRSKPPGPLLKGAHAIEREARAIGALAAAGFPVPRLHALCEDRSVIGTPFYVMEMIDGRIFRDASFPDIPRDGRAACLDAMNATIAALHAIPPAEVGLGDFGRPEGYVARQVARWSRQYVEDVEAGRDPAMDRLIAWLPDHVPASDETAIVHGDFRVDNLVFHPREPRVIAVLDWELATLGHPLADFAYHAMMYRMPHAIWGGLAETDLAAAGLPGEAAYLEAYRRRTGRAALADYGFYLIFGMFRFAAILHGIRGRIARGTAVGSDASRLSAHLPRVAALAWEQACRFG